MKNKVKESLLDGLIIALHYYMSIKSLPFICLYYIIYIMLYFLSFNIILIYSVAYPGSQDSASVGMSMNTFTLSTCSVKYSI